MESLSPSLDQGFDEIEASVLPNLALLLDGLIDAAGAARAGVDALHYAAEVRMLALGTLEVTRQVEALLLAAEPQPRLRMSA
jgi:hypothetical protein